MLTPFFKRGTVASVGSKPDLSQVGQPEAKQGSTSLVSAPTRPAKEIAPAPAPAVRRPSDPTRPGSIWEGLIDLRETEPLLDRVLDSSRPVAAPQASRRNFRPWSTAYEKLSRSGPRAWWAAAGVLLLGFVIAWVVLRVKPSQTEGRKKFTERFEPSTKRTHELPKDDAQAPISNSIGMTLKLIRADEFFMGSPDDDKEAEKDEKPSHRVRISKPFYLGVYEVTQGQYEAVMGNNPSYFSANGGGKDRVTGQSTDRYPVDQVSWRDAVQFCNKLSEMEGEKPFYEIDGKEIRVPDWNGQGYRLPTEAEWEYACRANASTPTRFSFGDNVVKLGLHGWFDGNSKQRTHPVGQKRPNGFGLYDMHGNVCEWCWDWFGEGYYNQSVADDPTGPAGGSYRVLRGGDCFYSPRCVRSAYRNWYPPGVGFSSVGFRVARGQSGR